LAQRWRLKALPTTILITLYMIPVWKVYGWLAALIGNCE